MANSRGSNRGVRVISLFDIFSNDSAEQAARDKIAGLNAGYAQASGLFGKGRDALTTNYGKAAQPFEALLNNPIGQAGYGAYADASGAGGAAGYDRARTNFQQNPGYQFQFDQGLKAIDRGAASRGMATSGNTLAAEQQFGTGLANQSYKDYMAGLSPYLQYPTQQTAAATGNAGVYQGLGNSLNSSYGNQGNLAFQTQTGVGNANAAADLNNYNVSSNMWGALMNGAKLAAGFV